MAVLNVRTVWFGEVWVTWASVSTPPEVMTSTDGHEKARLWFTVHDADAEPWVWMYPEPGAPVGPCIPPVIRRRRIGDGVGVARIVVVGISFTRVAM
jgi:hypothetical protein